MFSRQDLVAELTALSIVQSPPLEIVEFSHKDFESPGSEQSIEVFRGFKRDFASSLLFWIETLRAQDWQGREPNFAPYATSALCEPIDREEFARLVGEYSGSLKPSLPEFLVPLVGFQSGLRMYANWNDVAAVAELDESFVAFYWLTTA